DTFGDLVTYPTITKVRAATPGKTRVLRRDGAKGSVRLPSGQDSWLPWLEGAQPTSTRLTLADLCLRLSCGVATGADGVFVRPVEGLDQGLRRFAYPTIAGRELTPATVDLPRRFVMLIPYDENGRLLPVDELGALGRYLRQGEVRARLLSRTCVKRKPWYAFHETPPLQDILRPKILCKDIVETPQFWIDRDGEIVPRHSVYYIVPREPTAIDPIANYLESPAAQDWLARNCQRAAKGFLRLQSRVLQRLPIPDNVARAAGGRPTSSARSRPLQTQLSVR
ncbi:MAG: Eco57I restriction-modification methylase domain-containing protein, partial [Gammaproteobacteria bacterium]